MSTTSTNPHDCDSFKGQTADDIAIQDERDEHMSTSSKSTQRSDRVVDWEEEEYDSDVEDAIFIEWLKRLTVDRLAVDPIRARMTIVLEEGLSILRSSILGNGTRSMKAALLYDDKLILATSLQDKYTNVVSEPKPKTARAPPIFEIDYSRRRIQDFSSQVELMTAFCDIISAHQNLFSHGILHKNIDLYNIAIVGGRGALIDFDLIQE